MALQFLARSTGFLACLSLVMPAAAAAAAATVPQPEPEVKPSDTDALTIFRHGADAHGILAANWSRGDACTGRWTGVGCPADGRRVTSLMLSSLDLRGPLDPLSHLAELRALDLRGATPEHPHPLSDAADAQRRDKRSSAAAAAAASLPEWVRSVVREEWTAEVFDVELLRYRDIEEEMVAMLHVALACVVPQPEQRPSMGDVVRMIESVPVDQSPMPEEDRDVSPSIGVTTDDGGGRRSY